MLAVRDNLENEVERLAAESQYVKQKAEEYSTELRALLDKVRGFSFGGNCFALRSIDPLTYKKTEAILGLPSKVPPPLPGPSRIRPQPLDETVG